MTFEEAKKILKKEGFVLNKIGKRLLPDKAFIEYEDPDVCEAMQIIESAGFGIGMELNRFDERKARLKEEREKHSNAPMPAPGEVKAEDGDLKAATDAFVVQVNEIMRLKKENAELLEAIDKMKEGNPALKESASQFNDALLDEQAKKIAELTKDKSNLEDQITVLNACKKHNDKIDRKQIKCLGKEIARLNGIIHDKNAILSDVAEELRLTKIREKNLVEVSQKYMKENEELKKNLADKVVDKIDAQALKSAESALAWKEKVISYKDMALAYHEKKIAEKEKVIADLGKELSAQKDLVDDISLKYDGAKYNLKLRMDECEKLKEELEEANNRIKAIHNASKEYCEYGIAAEKMIQKMADVIVYDRPVFSKEFEEYRRWANGYRYNPKLYNFIEEEEKKFSPVKDTHPTEDNPEEVKMNEILEHVRKVLEEGGMVSTSYDKAEEGGDQSATIVQHRKSIVDLFKEIKRLWQE